MSYKLVKENKALKIFKIGRLLTAGLTFLKVVRFWT